LVPITTSRSAFEGAWPFSVPSPNTTPVAVATDGGTVHAADPDTTDDETQTRERRPDDCGCWDPDGDLSCFSCWMAGFETPSPDVDAGDENR
jgi:hypothetical protein